MGEEEGVNRSPLWAIHVALPQDQEARPAVEQLHYWWGLCRWRAPARSQLLSRFHWFALPQQHLHGCSGEW